MKKSINSTVARKECLLIIRTIVSSVIRVIIAKIINLDKKSIPNRTPHIIITYNAVSPVVFPAETMYPGSAPIRFNLLNIKPFGLICPRGFLFETSLDNL